MKLRHIVAQFGLGMIFLSMILIITGVWVSDNSVSSKFVFTGFFVIMYGVGCFAVHDYLIKRAEEPENQAEYY